MASQSGDGRAIAKLARHKPVAGPPPVHRARQSVDKMSQLQKELGFAAGLSDPASGRTRQGAMHLAYFQLSGAAGATGTLSGAPPTETGPTGLESRTNRLRIAADSP